MGMPFVRSFKKTNYERKLGVGIFSLRGEGSVLTGLSLSLRCGNDRLAEE